MVTFAPTYLMNTVKMDPGHMSIAMAGLGLGGVIWGFGVPTISDRLGRKTCVIIASFVCMFSPLALIFLHFNYMLLAVVLVIVHCAQGAHVLILSVIPSETVPQKYIPAAVGLIMGIGEVVGGVIHADHRRKGCGHNQSCCPVYHRGGVRVHCGLPGVWTARDGAA